MNNKITPLEWDSQFFSLKIGSIWSDDQNIQDIADDLLTNMTFLDYDLVYVNVPAKKMATECSKNRLFSFKLVDTKVTLNCNTKELSGKNVPIQFCTCRNPALSKQQLEKIQLLSIQAGQHSRFKDPLLPKSSFEKLYKIWAEKSVNRNIADYFWVTNQADPLGFITLSTNNDDNIGVIGLLSVDSKARGMGIGRCLIKKVFELASDLQLSSINVSTQLKNQQALKFYINTGFKESVRKNIYHLWINK